MSQSQTFRALPQGVLRDVLRLGNRDRFCASLIAWLLEGQGEHGLGGAVQEQLGVFLEGQGHAELGIALQSGVLPVTGQVTERGQATDLVVSLAGAPKLVLLATAGLLANSPIIAEYQAKELVPLGVRYPGDPPAKQLGSFAVWDWSLEFAGLASRAPAGPYGDFLRQFAEYLQAPEVPVAAPTTPQPLSPAPQPAPDAGGGWGGSWSDTGGGLADQWASEPPAAPASPPATPATPATPAPTPPPPVAPAAPGGGLADAWGNDAGGGLADAWGDDAAGGGVADGWGGGGGGLADAWLDQDPDSGG